MSTEGKAECLRAVVKLLVEASEVVINEWEKEEQEPNSKTTGLPSHELHNARRTALGAIGAYRELVVDPSAHLMEITLQFFESRALHIATEVRIADILDEGDHNNAGVHIDEISRRTGIKSHKAARILRLLCTSHVFREVSYDYFANNSVSQTLVGNGTLRAFILTMAWSIYTASDKLPEVLMDPVKTQSESALESAFQAAHNTKLHFWEWFEEPLKQLDGTTQPKRELAAFGLGMVGGGRALGVPLYFDYPWQELDPSATVVDVGGGVELSKVHPNLNFIIQDRPAVIKQAETIWQRDAPDALKNKRTTLQVHDFFTEQPVKNAEVYHMRYIMHDWPDEECIKILTSIRPALGPKSRILISDSVMLPTCPQSTPSFAPAPAPLLANYGIASRYNHMRDLNMLTLLNGRERNPEEWRDLAKRAGLRVEKIWETRSVVWIIEMRKEGT
ncbi:hypothetical protein EUX98_g8214 [Antrodiella citrinella]|uniref:Uncharacterized protein n=1 Tax=Antrodiella citrinella TaxID=2447956 RepID=A0A4S4MAB7_9APHY|nr:hypothetical protein EUX98_g8214 [Antrodiella citrinella]